MRAIERVGDVRALNDKADVVNCGGLAAQDGHQPFGDDALLFRRVADTGKRSQKLLACVDAPQIQPQIVVIIRHHLLGLILAQQSGVDEDAVELVSDGKVAQHGAHAAVNAAGQAAQRAAAIRRAVDFLAGAVNQRLIRPPRGAAADVLAEADEQMTRKGVVPLQLEGEAPHVAVAGVEAEHPAVRCGNRRSLRVVQRHKPCGRLIAVGVLHAVQQGI